MTLEERRDYLAAHCPTEIIGNPKVSEIRKFEGIIPNEESLDADCYTPEYIRRWKCAKRYEWADTMMEVSEISKSQLKLRL
jgi:hypothetical protein